MTTDAPTTEMAVWPPEGFNPEDLPRPATLDQAVKALEMAAGKHPKNRVLVELRTRPDGSPLRSGDLRAFAAILQLWAGTSTVERPAQIDSEPRSEAPEGNRVHGNGAPDVATLERVRDALANLPGDPFTGPAPVDLTAFADDGWDPAQLLEHPDPFTGPAPVPFDSVTPDERAAVVETAERLAEPEPGGEPLPKGEPGAAPGATPASYAAEPRVSEPAPAATAPDPFTGARQYVTRRSPSQVTSYHECGTRYHLERVERTYQIPAWWNIGGNAFHETVRWWEFEHAEGTTHSPDETARKFELAFSDELAKVVLANAGSNIGPSQYRAANRGTEDRDWWRDHGPTMAADYVTGQVGRETDVLRLSPDVLALELGFTVNIGGIDVTGFIDQALIVPSTGAVIVRDHKTGSRIPDDPLQLQIYAIALRRVFGVDRPIWANYWRARRTTKREPGETKPVLIDIDDVEPIVAWRVREMDRAERAGVYPARPSSFCGSCGVRGLCPVMGPPETRRLDLLAS